MVAAAFPAQLRRLERVEQRRAAPPADLADPLALCARLGFAPDDWQRDVLTSRARQLILEGDDAARRRFLSQYTG